MGKKAGEKLELLQGTLDMMVLRTLSAGPANGYEIARAIERLSDEVLAIDHGSLYPALQRLERGGVISGKWETSQWKELVPAGSEFSSPRSLSAQGAAWTQ